MGTDNCGKINIAIAGLGNCASSLIEGICFYRQNPDTEAGLLFPELCGYSVADMDVVAAFDISAAKVGQPLCRAIYQEPNNFVRIKEVRVDSDAPVFRGPTLDGNPEHLAKFVKESAEQTVEVDAVLRTHNAHVLINMMPTGSIQATEYYAEAALKAGCAFINCIPTPLAQRADFQELFAKRGLPLLGDDIKSQMGTTILHRALLGLLGLRGATLKRTSQINIGGNTDFANFVHRGETKLASKKKSLMKYVENAEFHVGHHYDPTKGALKNALIQIETSVFGCSTVKLEVRLESDDKPNCAGSVADLVRLAKGAMDRGIGGYIPEACAFYMKSPPVEMADDHAAETIRRNWLS